MTASDDLLADALRDNGPDLLRYLQRRAPHEAADLLGATMLVAWRRKAVRPPTKAELRPCLFGIARTTLRGHHRDEARQLRPTERVRLLAPMPTEPDDAAAIDVRNAIAALPDKQREVVELVHWEGLSLVDTAVVLGIKASSARGRYAKARGSLHLALASAVVEMR